MRREKRRERWEDRVQCNNYISIVHSLVPFELSNCYRSSVNDNFMYANCAICSNPSLLMRETTIMTLPSLDKSASSVSLAPL